MNLKYIVITLLFSCTFAQAKSRIDILKSLMQRKDMNLSRKKCIPCEGRIAPFTEDQENDFIRAVPNWALEKEDVHKIVRHYTFKDFIQAMAFINKVADIAEEQGHHPVITINYNKVTLEFFTFAINGLSENDFIMASKIDELAA